MTDINVELVYVTPDVQESIPVSVRSGSTIEDAVQVSGIREKYPEIDFTSMDKGIWNTVRSGNTVLKAGDRVEIYRPLIMDAKTARRKRAEKKAESS